MGVEIVQGDATVIPSVKKHHILFHVCNDIGAWGAGFTGALSAAWPAAEKTYRGQESWLLGSYSKVDYSGHTIYNLVAQRGIRAQARGIPNVRYIVLHNVIQKMIEDVELTYGADNVVYQCPKIGAGLGGGDWKTIMKILSELFVDRTLTVYTLNSEDVNADETP